MIDQAVEYIRQELREHLGLGLTEVVANHPHVLKDDSGAGGALIALVNIKEEVALKNNEPYVRRNGTTRRQEPGVHLNLYLLFAFEFTDYEKTLLHLGKTVELFQNRRYFSAGNHDPTHTLPFPVGLERLVFDFHNLDFEALNHMWGVLGGTYFPCVLYKVRLVTIRADDIRDVDSIQAIELVTNVT